MQYVLAGTAGNVKTLKLPDPETPVWSGLNWGRFEEPLTPAFWASQSWMTTLTGEVTFELGKSLQEEVVYCLLGGYGAPAEIGLAASKRICDLLKSLSPVLPDVTQIEEKLREPLLVQGRYVRYRFASQRAKYLAASLARLSEVSEAEYADIELRDYLRTLPGIGPKTASWIVRNRRGSDRVAILDVHIIRACSLIGVFPLDARPERGYGNLERQFIDFSEAINTRASILDTTMWGTMRGISRRLMQQIVDSFIPAPHPKDARKNGGGYVARGCRQLSRR